MTINSSSTCFPKRKGKSKERPVHKCHKSMIYNSENLEIIQMLTNRWMNKQIMVYPYNGILFAIKRTTGMHNNMDEF